MSARTIPALATVGRAYAAGRVSALRPPSPLNAYRLAAALASASPEVRAAYAAGRAADPAGPMPEPQAALAAVVQRLARPGVEELPDSGTRPDPSGTTAGPECAAPGQLGQNGLAL